MKNKYLLLSAGQQGTNINKHVHESERVQQTKCYDS